MRERAVWFQTARRAGSGWAASTAATAAMATDATLPPATVPAASAGPAHVVMKARLIFFNVLLRFVCCVLNCGFFWSQNVLQATLAPTVSSGATVRTTAPVTE